jgi:hypothetical protein
MKMVKSLLLISAAGFVAMSGAQAADLPVKAKPVEYVKICSLYGAGFYYIPGTDICMKIGGYVRYQLNTGMGNSISFGPFTTTGGFNTRQQGIDLGQRVRVIVSQDTRQQTAYGTLRTYLILGWTHDTPTSTTSPAAPTVYFNRGFIQIAGFTLGKATSFFDFASTAAVAYNAGFVTTSDTGDAGQIVGSYTAQFGNGVSATLGIEQSRRDATIWAGPIAGGPGQPAALSAAQIAANSPLGAGFALAGLTSDNLGGLNAGTASRPDIVANFRVDQAWGSAQIMGALHDVSAAYYGGSSGLATSGVGTGHPDDKWGWAAGVGLRLNAPMIGPGDYFQAQFGYAEGATKYTTNSSCGGSAICNFWNGSSFGFGMAGDGNFTGVAGGTGLAAPSGINLTTSWSVFASYEHFWTPALRTSLYGSYLDVSRNAAGNTAFCGAVLRAVDFAAGMPCDGNWQQFTIGSRSQWNVTKDFYVGLDVIYSKLNSASINNGAPFIASSAFTVPGRPSPLALGTFNTADQDAVSVTWRVHRDIVP